MEILGCADNGSSADKGSSWVYYVQGLRDSQECLKLTVGSVVDGEFQSFVGLVQQLPEDRKRQGQWSRGFQQDAYGGMLCEDLAHAAPCFITEGEREPPRLFSAVLCPSLR